MFASAYQPSQAQFNCSARSSASSVFDDPAEIMIESNFDPADTSLGAEYGDDKSVGLSCAVYHRLSSFG
jgi:hypothetical protein